MPADFFETPVIFYQLRENINRPGNRKDNHSSQENIEVEFNHLVSPVKEKSEKIKKSDHQNNRTGNFNNHVNQYGCVRPADGIGDTALSLSPSPAAG